MNRSATVGAIAALVLSLGGIQFGSAADLLPAAPQHDVSEPHVVDLRTAECGGPHHPCPEESPHPECGGPHAEPCHEQPPAECGGPHHPCPEESPHPECGGPHQEPCHPDESDENDH